MKTKIIPFELETAKKIQAGEIEGTIETKRGDIVRIVYWERKGEYPILGLVGRYEDIISFCENGQIYTTKQTDDDLVLEVIDNESQFKPFDRVLVRDEDNQIWSCSIFSHIDKVQDGKVIYNASGLTWYQCIPYDGNEYLVGTTNKPK